MYNNFTDYPQDPNEYIMHADHKYIDKKWINGKWQYIYKDVIGVGRKKSMNLSRENMERAGREANASYTSYQHATNGITRASRKKQWERDRDTQQVLRSKYEYDKSKYDKSLLGRIDNGTAGMRKKARHLKTSASLALKDAPGSLRRAGKYVSGKAGAAGKYISGKAGTAGKYISGKAGAAGKAVGKMARDAYYDIKRIPQTASKNELKRRNGTDMYGNPAQYGPIRPGDNPNWRVRKRYGKNFKY